MRINRLWLLCDDGVVRPVIRGEVLSADGSRVQAFFLVDTAADRTDFSQDVLAALQLPAGLPTESLSGVGGTTPSVIIQTQVEFPREHGSPVVFRGPFAAFTDPEALDMSVLGRDIMNLFALIADRPQDVVCLLSQRHYYSIHER
jgi:hypothetical protein